MIGRRMRAAARSTAVGRRRRAAVAATLVLAAVTGTVTSSATASTPADGVTLRIGYSAWPGWFPLAVAEEAGLFEEAGVDVELTFFADYISSLDALVAGSLDVNTQTLNDTIFAVAAGSEQRIIATNDNSTGNDAVICDESISSIAELAGTSIAAEPGVVDHFLLLQGLATEGLTEEDIEFQGLPTDAAAGAFAGGEFDCVAVFAPFTIQALEREGSAVLFSSADFPGSISDHFVATAAAVEDHPEELQRLVDAWYLTLDWIDRQPGRGDSDHGGGRRRLPGGVRRLRRRHDDLRRRAGPRCLRGPARRPDIASRDGAADQPVPRRVGTHRDRGRPERPLRARLHGGVRGERRRLRFSSVLSTDASE